MHRRQKHFDFILGGGTVVVRLHRLSGRREGVWEEGFLCAVSQRVYHTWKVQNGLAEHAQWHWSCTFYLLSFAVFLFVAAGSQVSSILCLTIIYTICSREHAHVICSCSSKMHVPRAPPPPPPPPPQPQDLGGHVPMPPPIPLPLPMIWGVGESSILLHLSLQQEQYLPPPFPIQLPVFKEMVTFGAEMKEKHFFLDVWTY